MRLERHRTEIFRLAVPLPAGWKGIVLVSIVNSDRSCAMQELGSAAIEPSRTSDHVLLRRIRQTFVLDSLVAAIAERITQIENCLRRQGDKVNVSELT